MLLLMASGAQDAEGGIQVGSIPFRNFCLHFCFVLKRHMNSNFSHHSVRASLLQQLEPTVTEASEGVGEGLS